MKLFLINNDGGGFADHVEVAPGTTIIQLFEQHLPGRKAEDYLIRVDRQPVSRDHVLVEGNRVSITPTKIAGAVARPFTRASTRPFTRAFAVA